MDPDAGRAASGHADLRADLAVVRAYAEDYPTAWRGFRFERDRVVAVFVNADPHRSAIAELVSDPARMDVQTARYSEREIESVFAAIKLRLESARGTWSSVSAQIDVVRVNFLGKGEAVARELHERFGDAVTLTVGGFAYPFAVPPPAVELPRAPRSTLHGSSIGVRAVPDTQSVMSGEQLTGHVVVTNLHPDEQLVLDTDQPLDGHLLRADLIVGVSFANTVGTGRGVQLDPGQSTEIEFSAGTDSRDPGDGPTLPPGRYDLIVTMPVYELARIAQRDEQLVTPPEPITVTPRDAVETRA